MIASNVFRNVKETTKECTQMKVTVLGSEIDYN